MSLRDAVVRTKRSNDRLVRNQALAGREYCARERMAASWNCTAARGISTKVWNGADLANWFERHIGTAYGTEILRLCL